METNPQKDTALEMTEMPQAEAAGEANTSDHPSQPEGKKRVKHEDHHVSRKYKLFSNHSSYGDSPHTNTSF